MRNFLMNGMAVLAAGLLAASCSTEDFSMSDAKGNAEKVFGVKIDPNQNWKLTQSITANVTVNLGLDQQYIVAIYDRNPLYSNDVSYYGRQTVAEGGTASIPIAVPTADSTFYVAVFDSHYRRMVKSVTINNGALNTSFGTPAASRRATRAAEDAGTYPAFVKTLNDYLNPVVTLWGNTLTTMQISLDNVASYTPISDDLIVNQTSNGNHTLSDGSSAAGLNGAYPGNSDGKHFRVPAGTVITESFNINAEYGKVNDAVVYIAGEVHLKGNTLNGPTLIVASGGKIVIDSNTSMSNAGRIVVLPGGQITGADGVEFNVNNGMPCFNAGTIEFNGQLNVNGSDFYNKGTVNVDLLRNTSGGTFTNFGQITARTNMQAGDAYNSTVINGCYMHFKEDAGIGTLTNLDNSRLEVGGIAQFNMGTQTLYNASLIKAGTMYLNSTSFAGPTGGNTFAVVQTGRISVNQGADIKGVTGNVYFDWNVDNLVNHNYTADYNTTVDNGYTWLSYIKGLNLNYIDEASSPVSIPAGDCTGVGYHDTEGDDPDQELPGGSKIYTYAFEDSFMGDYDMNDVVLKVQENEYDENYIDVTLCCTGATYNLYVYLDQQRLFGGDEVHKVLGCPAGKFVNTGDYDGDKFYTADASRTTITIRKPANFSMGTADFWIKSPQGDIHVGTTYEQGSAPFGVVIPEDWAWPHEWTAVNLAYPDFSGFAANREVNTDWYKTPENSKVFK